MLNSEFIKFPTNSKYDFQAIRWLDKIDHYELIFTDDFVTPTSGSGRPGKIPLSFSHGNSILTDVITDMREGNKSKEVHVFVGSFGGEVAALNMILQQLITYEHRVGINLGTACSCGWMLLFACQERYVSPFSQAMYHDISSYCGGKHAELQLSAEFMGRWQDELLKITDTANVLTEKELELGRTTEVWLTGKDLIDRGAAKDYSKYLTRQIPVPMRKCIANPFGQIFVKALDGWVLLEVKEYHKVSYQDIVDSFNMSPGEFMAQFELSKDSKARSKKKTSEKVKTKRKNSAEKGGAKNGCETQEKQSA
ncbi:MAG: ATP-dependent Clp protease proteolytic subunit [Lentisphaeria bacterium]|nr:ATP-dependent Clp protease proteolytic subunit [Lentisphaeria bacterium]